MRHFDSWTRTVASLGLLALTASGCGTEDSTDQTAEDPSEAARVSVINGHIYPSPEGIPGFGFDGVDDRVTVPAHAAYNLGSGDFTFLVYARFDPTHTGSVETLLSRRTGDGDGFLFAAQGTRLLFQMNGVPNFVTPSEQPALTDGQLHAFAVRRAAGALQFFVDGVAIATTMDGAAEPAHSLRSINGTGPLAFGYDPPTGSAFKGELREVRMWSRALQVQGELTGGWPYVSGMIGYWFLPTTSAQFVVDYTETNDLGVLGSSAQIDATDPTQVVGVERIERLRVRKGGGNMLRVEGIEEVQTVDVGKACGGILVDGTMETFTWTGTRTLSEETKDWYCDQVFNKEMLDRRGNLELGISIKGVPIGLKGGNQNTENKETFRNFCSDKTKTVSDTEAATWSTENTSDAIAAAWLGCIKAFLEVQRNPNVVGSQSVSSDGRSVTLTATWDNGGSSLKAQPTVHSFVVEGGTCTGQFVAGTLIGAGGISQVCTRTADKPIVATLFTNDGAVTWDVVGLGKIASVWATATVPTTEYKVAERQCTSGTQWGRCFRNIRGLKCPGGEIHLALATSGSAVYKNCAMTPGNGSYGVRAVWCDGNETQSVRGFATATTETSVTFSLCADRYDYVTTYDDGYKSVTPISAYRDRQFVVELPPKASQGILHIDYVDGGSTVVDLTKTVTQAGVRVVAGPANGQEQNYLVTISNP